MTSRRIRRRSPADPQRRGCGPGDGAAGTVISHMVGIGLFLAILALGLAYLGVLSAPSVSQGDVDLDSKAQNTLSVLVGGPGIPEDWEDNPSNLKRLGLLKPGTTITVSQGKVEALQPGNGVTYDEANDALGLDEHEFRLQTQPQLKGDKNRTALEDYRLGYVGFYDDGTESTQSENESDALDETAATYNDTLAGGDNLLADPGDKYKAKRHYMNKHLLPRLAGLWFNDDGAKTGEASHTWWSVVNTTRSSVDTLDTDHDQVLATSNWTGSTWDYEDGEADRIYAVKANLTGYTASDHVWFNFTHWIDGVGSDLLSTSDHGKIQTRPVDAGDLDVWDTENAGAFYDNGTKTDFNETSVKIEENLDDEVWIAFLWETAGGTVEDRGWFVGNWTLEGIDDGQEEVIAQNQLDYETTRHDALMVGEAANHGQLSEDDVKTQIQDWVRAGGDLMGMAPNHQGGGQSAPSTEFLDPWIDDSTEQEVTGDIDESKSLTDHSLLTTPSTLDWKNWPMTDSVWGVNHTDPFTWVLVRDDPDDDEHEPALAITQPNATGDGTIILSSQKATDMGTESRRHYTENALVTLRYRGLFLDLGDPPPVGSAVGSSSAVTLVDTTDGNLDHPNFEVFVDVWK